MVFNGLNVPSQCTRNYIQRIWWIFEEQECEDNKILVENMMADYETKRGNTVYIESYCIEMKAFENKLKEKQNKIKGTSLGV